MYHVTIILYKPIRLTPYSLQSSVRYSVGTTAAVVITTNSSPRRIGGGRQRQHGRDSAAATSAADHGGVTTASCCSWHRLTTRRRTNGSCLRPSLCAGLSCKQTGCVLIGVKSGASYAVEWCRRRHGIIIWSNRFEYLLLRDDVDKINVYTFFVRINVTILWRRVMIEPRSPSQNMTRQRQTATRTTTTTWLYGPIVVNCSR